MAANRFILSRASTIPQGLRHIGFGKICVTNKYEDRNMKLKKLSDVVIYFPLMMFLMNTRY